MVDSGVVEVAAVDLATVEAVAVVVEDSVDEEEAVEEVAASVQAVVVTRVRRSPSTKCQKGEFELFGHALLRMVIGMISISQRKKMGGVTRRSKKSFAWIAFRFFAC